MCLITNTNIPKVADTNIPVWKVVKRVSLPFFGVYSYYSLYFSSFKIGASNQFPITVTPKELSPTLETVQYNKPPYFVTSGVIHVVKTEEAAKRLLEVENKPFLWLSTDSPLTILKGYIPIGTSYFEGSSQDLAATKIIFEKEEELCV